MRVSIVSFGSVLRSIHGKVRKGYNLLLLHFYMLPHLAVLHFNIGDYAAKTAILSYMELNSSKWFVDSASRKDKKRPDVIQKIH